MSVTFNITFTLKQDVVQFKQGSLIYLLGILCTYWRRKCLFHRSMYHWCICHSLRWYCWLWTQYHTDLLGTLGTDRIVFLHRWTLDGWQNNP